MSSYIGGAGAKSPVLHYDNLHTHAFLMQLYGEKEYFCAGADQTEFVYPRTGVESNKSNIDNVEHPDAARFPLFSEAKGIRSSCYRMNTVLPQAAWHTARIISTSITVSINGENEPNWRQFSRDYCASVAASSRLKAAWMLPYLLIPGDVLTWIYGEL